jgi:hypothetical protein
LLEKPATLMASGDRLYLWVTFRPSWGGVPCRIALTVNGFRGKIRLSPQFFTPGRGFGYIPGSNAMPM